jgi:polar amino acid transport system substrate-binding protein
VRNKSILAALLATALGLAGAVLAPAAGARTLAEIKADGKLVIGTEGAFPPFNYFDGSKLTGFEIELGDAIGKKMGLTVQWKTVGFDSLLAGLRQDRFDLVMASFAVTPERAKAVAFTQPVYCGGGVIVAKDPQIHTAASLSGKVVSVQTGTTYFEKVKKVASIKEVKNYPRDTDAQQALMNGRVDAWVTDRFVVKKALETAPKAGLRIGDYLFVEKVAAALKLGNPTLSAAFDKALAEVQADGTYKKLSEKYLKEDIRCK